MDTEKADEMNAGYVPAFWGLDYTACGMVFLLRAVHLWGPMQSRPMEVSGLTLGGLALLYCFLLLWVARNFRRRLKGEMEKGSMSTRTFVVCDLRIAQLLLIAYMGMALFDIRS